MRRFLAGARIKEMADRFGTPFYLYDAERIRERYHQLRQTITYPELAIHFAIKAQPSVALLRLLGDLGAGADACSVSDLLFANAAGLDPRRATFTCCGLSAKELEAVARHGAFFIADSLSQVERYGCLAPGRSIGIRVHTHIEAGFHPHVRTGGSGGKFGLLPGEIKEAIALAHSRDLEVTCLHTHIGSDILEPSGLIDALERLIGHADLVPGLTAIDAGGGIGQPFWPEDGEFDLVGYGRAVSDLMDGISRRRGDRIHLILEPGAFLVQDAGYLVARVTELRPPARGRPRFAYVDANCNQAISALLYGTRRGLHAPASDGPRMLRYHVAGTTMQAGDIFAEDAELPELAIGDPVVVENCGSYCSARASTFNGRPRPGEVLLDGDRFIEIRRAESAADLLETQVWSHTE